MVMSGHITQHVLAHAVVAIPAVLLGAYVGVTLFRKSTDKLFQAIILGLLMVSGLNLLWQVG